VRAAATLYDPSDLVVDDEPLGAATMWGLRPGRACSVYTVPDLSWDVVWLPGERPRASPRTVTPLTTPVDRGGRVVGVRFPPAVVAVDVDAAWDGWNADSVDERDLLRRALTAGGVRVEIDDRLSRVLSALDRPRARIASVASALGASERQLERWALDATGLTPKELHRHLRLRRFWELEPSLPLAHRAVAAGFYDQAHASAEVRALTGLSPSRLVRLAMSDSSKTTGER
jgi:AraC-like DNA-binding protein